MRRGEGMNTNTQWRGRFHGAVAGVLQNKGLTTLNGALKGKGIFWSFTHVSLAADDYP